MNSKTILLVSVGVCLGVTASAQDEKSIKDLRDTLIALSPRTVDPNEAALLSATAHQTSRQLAREYGVTGDPAVHNYLIRVGARQKGICADYVNDIGARLRELRFKTLVLHWGTAWEKESSENNGLIITALNQPFLDGIVLDGWRRAGRLFWCPVRDDHEYEIELYPALNQLGKQSHSGVTAWKEDLQRTALLQPPPAPSKPALKLKTVRR